MKKKFLVITLALALLIVFGGIAAAANDSIEADAPALVAGGLNGSTGMGSTIGPGHDLYVTEGAAGTILRVDTRTGQVTPFASGLPQGNPAIGIGGPMDVAFRDDIAYALVTLVGPDVGGMDVVGIYRMDGPSSWSVFANIGDWAIANPPATPFDVPSGVQYAFQTFRDGFLVTDGHHNRVLWVDPDGAISELIGFGNIVPTGLDTHGNEVYMARAGAVPHPAAEGKVVAFKFGGPAETEVAAGAMLAVDVEFGRGRSLYALAQGIWNGGGAGSSAYPNTGQLLEVNDDGTMTLLADGLDRPTSMEIVRNTAYYVTLGGEVWKIEGL